jgi:hypothetical protein
VIKSKEKKGEIMQEGMKESGSYAEITLKKGCYDLFMLMEYFQKETKDALEGNKSAARRARVVSKEIERELLIFRKKSVLEIG